MFRFSENSSLGYLRDVQLTDFLRATKGIRDANVYFDTNRMGCPFDVRVTVLMPYSRNKVVQVGSTHPERTMFMEWLSTRELEASVDVLSQVLGKYATVTVPCAVIDLTPAIPGGTGSK
jgi:hypothetical protein